MSEPAISEIYADHPLETVEAAFEGFIADDTSRAANFSLPHVKPVLFRTGAETKQGWSKEPGYSVKVAFSERQMPYVQSVDTLCRDLCNELDDHQKAFLDRLILEEWQKDDNRSFDEVLYEAIIKMYEEFCIRHPNMTPALKAIMHVAGTIGIRSLVARARQTLKFAVDGELNSENLVANAHIARLEFVAPIPNVEPTFAMVFGDIPSKTGERLCQGMETARTIRMASCRTAVDIATRFSPTAERAESFAFDDNEAALKLIKDRMAKVLG